MLRFYADGGNTARTATVISLLGRVGHAEGMIWASRRTVGLRFTILYAAVFLLSGVGLLILTFLLSGGQVSNTSPVPGQVTGQGPPDSSLAAAQQQIRDLQEQLAGVNAEYSRQLLAGSVAALVVMVVISLVLGRALAGRVLRPLRLITAATNRITADNLDRRLAVNGPADELRELADTFDAMLARLDAAFAAQQRFVANASHELRTPLATMRASLDVAVAKPEPAAQTLTLANRMRTQLDQVDHLLDGFLLLARTQHGALADAEPVDCGELVSHALAARADDVAAKQLVVESGPPEPAWTRGNPALLSRLVENLVDNAIRHNDHGGWISVDTSGREGGGDEMIRLVVESGGPVLEQGDVDRLGRPFQRIGADRIGSEAGTGLGLSIVSGIAAAHGGRLELRAGLGGGLRATVMLPACRAAQVTG
jgi:signal transduction histidine kinase